MIQRASEKSPCYGTKWIHPRPKGESLEIETQLTINISSMQQKPTLASLPICFRLSQPCYCNTSSFEGGLKCFQVQPCYCNTSSFEGGVQMFPSSGPEYFSDDEGRATRCEFVNIRRVALLTICPLLLQATAEIQNTKLSTPVYEPLIKYKIHKYKLSTPVASQ